MGTGLRPVQGERSSPGFATPVGTAALGCPGERSSPPFPSCHPERGPVIQNRSESKDLAFPRGCPTFGRTRMSFTVSANPRRPNVGYLALWRGRPRPRTLSSEGVILRAFRPEGSRVHLHNLCGHGAPPRAGRAQLASPSAAQRRKTIAPGVSPGNALSNSPIPQFPDSSIPQSPLPVTPITSAPARICYPCLVPSACFLRP